MDATSARDEAKGSNSETTTRSVAGTAAVAEEANPALEPAAAVAPAAPEANSAPAGAGGANPAPVNAARAGSSSGAEPPGAGGVAGGRSKVPHSCNAELMGVAVVFSPGVRGANGSASSLTTSLSAASTLTGSVSSAPAAGEAPESGEGPVEGFLPVDISVSNLPLEADSELPIPEKLLVLALANPRIRYSVIDGLLPQRILQIWCGGEGVGANLTKP